MPAANKSNEISITRVYDAPTQAVWDAWTDPAKTALWWGPRGFTLTNHSMDLRPGGFWRYTMHGPDGVDYPGVIKYDEISPLSKLVYDHGWTDNKPPMFRVTVIFSEPSKGKTKMDMTMAFATPDDVERSRLVIRKFGGNSTWDRLAEYVEKQSTGKDQFVINRSFNAPLEHMFDMWTDPKHISRWTPPAGFEMEFLETDIRPGGTSRYRMFDSKGAAMYGRVSYLELRRPDHLRYTQQFTDEEGNVSRHPGAPSWPETMLTTVTLTAEGPDQTRVTVAWEPYGQANPEEILAFLKMRPSMTQGWTGTFDKLEQILN